jgi:Leucine-rich repeat (LRR) protein
MPQQEGFKKRLETAYKTGKLELSSMGLPIVPVDVFSIPNLRSLSLADNQIKTVSRDIGLLSAVTQLRLSGNQLTTLPLEIGTLTGLQTLWIQNNKMASVPAGILELTSLTALSMSGNQITWLPIQMINLTNLKDLHIDSPYLKSPPPAMAAKGARSIMEYLKTLNKAAMTGSLDLSGIGLEHFPPDVGMITSLTKLRLADNNMTSLSDDIQGLSNIIDLDVSRNKISTISPYVKHFTALTSLYLDKNPVQELPCELCFCSRLRTLSITGTSLVSPPAKVVFKGKYKELLSMHIWHHRHTHTQTYAHTHTHTHTHTQRRTLPKCTARIHLDDICISASLIIWFSKVFH